MSQCEVKRKREGGREREKAEGGEGSVLGQEHTEY